MKLLQKRWYATAGEKDKGDNVTDGFKTLGKGFTVITMSDSFVNLQKWRWDRCMYIDFVYKRRQKDLRKDIE
jgi:hypothetical protein